MPDSVVSADHRNFLFLNPVGIIGGGERVLLTLMAELRRCHPDLKLFLLLGTDGPLVAAATGLGVKVEVLPLPEELLSLGDSGLQSFWDKVQLLLSLGRGGLALWGYRRQLCQRIAAIQPDLIHSNGIKTHLLTGFLSRDISNQIPIVWHLHDFYSTRPLIAKILGYFRSTPQVGLAISEAVAKDAQLILAALPIRVIYNAIDTEKFLPAAPEPNSNQNSRPSSPLKIGLVATFARWKGQDLFLAAAAQVLKANPDLDLRFCLIGGPVYKTPGSQFSESELRDLADRLGIAAQVEFWGFQAEVNAVYQQLDIVVHASTQPEPFGMTIIEAMACAKPVIISAAGGAAELFISGETALGFELGNAQALAEAMNDLIAQPQERQRLGENARGMVMTRFNQPRFGQEVFDLYSKVISQGRH